MFQLQSTVLHKRATAPWAMCATMFLAMACGGGGTNGNNGPGGDAGGGGERSHGSDQGGGGEPGGAAGSANSAGGSAGANSAGGGAGMNSAGGNAGTDAQAGAPATGGMALGGMAATGGTATGGRQNTGGAPPTTSHPVAPGNGAFVESGGVVVWEAESPPNNSNLPAGWERQTQDAGYSGNGYLRWTGGNQYNSPGKGVLTYEFEIKTGGLYRFVWRNMKNGEESDKNNDSFVEFPSATGPDFYKHWFKVFGPNAARRFMFGNSGEPHNAYKGPVCVSFAAGKHTMRISGRSNEHAIDRIAFYKGDAGFISNDRFKFDTEDTDACRSAWVPATDLDRLPNSERAP